MDIQQLKEIIQEGESSTVEFKRKINTPEKIAKEIAAFANTIGGWLLIGIDDDKRIVGVESEKGSIDFIETACNFCINPPVEPRIEILNYQNKDIVAVYIEESKNKPHRLVNDPDENINNQNRAYIRVGEKSVIASREMARVLAGQNSDSKPVKLSIGDKERRLFNYLEKNERATVRDFAKLVNISDRRAERLMVRLVRAGVLQIHIDTAHDYFTLVQRSGKLIIKDLF